MANTQLFNLARMTVSSTGTGTITLSAAAPGFLTFDLAGCSTAATGQQITYAINDTNASEIGTGTYISSALTVTRGSSTVDLFSTNGNSPIAMSNTAQVCITPSAANIGLTGQVPGTTTNDSAAAGKVGEFVTSTVLIGGAIGLNTSSAANVTNITLTAGDWDVVGNVVFDYAAATVVNSLFGWISSQSAVTPTPGNTGYTATSGFGFVGASLPDITLPVTRTRYSISVASTTIYLSAQASFTTSTAKVYGTIAARRVR